MAGGRVEASVFGLDLGSRVIPSDSTSGALGEYSHVGLLMDLVSGLRSGAFSALAQLHRCGQSESG